MVSKRVFRSFVVSVFALLVAGSGVAIWSNDSVMGRVESAQPVAELGARDAWMDAARMGAPVYRSEGGPVTLPGKPSGKAIELAGNGLVFATDDLEDVRRWYAMLTAPVLDMSRYPAVRYLYEVEKVEMVKGDNGSDVLMISIHEARTGCERPACDPVTDLPNYDRRYVIARGNRTVYIEGGPNA